MRKLACNIICAFIPSKKTRRIIKEKMGIRKKPIVKETYGGRVIHWYDDAQKMVLDLLKTGKPCLIGRFGGTEFTAFKQWLEISKGKRKDFGEKIIKNMSMLSGFFPSNSQTLTKFAKGLKNVVANADIMAVWFITNEEEIMNEFCPNAQLIELNSFTPVSFDEPWSQYLEGKKVLVIHPFEKSIISQYKKREKLFKNPKVLPKFELKTIQAVQSIADAKEDLPFKDWFEALDYMKREIDKVDFDVAIVGAGAYGIFLAEYCKSIGKQAIHLAGSTQLLFGIYGKRWIENINNEDPMQMLINDDWTTPLEEEKPKGAEKVERGCYW